MGKEKLHAEIERLNFNDWKCRALLHAMVDAGKLVRLECQLEECKMDSRAFVARVGETAGRGQPGGKGLVIDHVIPRLQGGSDRPENLRVLHAACNNARTRGRKDTPETRAKKKAAAKARGEAAIRAMIDGRQPGWNKKTRPDDARRGGMRPRALTDEQVREVRRRFAAGETYGELAKDFGCSRDPIMFAVRGMHGYGDVV